MKMVVEKDVRKWKESLPEGSLGVRETVKRLETVVEHGQDGRGTQAQVGSAFERKRRFASAGAWAIGVVLAVMAIGLPFVIARMSGKGPGDYADLMGMQRKAEALAAGGSLTAAHDAYGELFEAANSQAIDNPMVLEKLAKAKRDEQRIAALLWEQERAKEEEARAAGEAMRKAYELVVGDRSQKTEVRSQKTEDRSQREEHGQLSTVSHATPVTAPATQMVREEVMVAGDTGRQAASGTKNRVVFGRPAVRLTKPQWDGITDQEIGESIQRGADFLLSQFKDGKLAGEIGGDQGLNALCVYALLQCGQAISDERLNGRAKVMKAMLDNLRYAKMPMWETYGRGIRATALAVYNRAEDRDGLKADVAWLMLATKSGGYTYGDGNRQYAANWDNSNSQYGLLGVWSGAEVGIEVPKTYWNKVQSHWYDCQQNSGDWNYGKYGWGDGTLSMTVAGIASLFVTHDYLEVPLFGTQVGASRSRPGCAGIGVAGAGRS